jgi:hypothetical protein
MSRHSAETGERLKIGLVACRRELDVERNTSQRADAHVVRVAASTAPHADLGLRRRAILADD